MPIETKINRTTDVLKAIEVLTEKEVLVGVPAENAGRKPEKGEDTVPLNNAEIGYVQEFGATIQTIGGGEFEIPPRPHLRPGVLNAKDKIVQFLTEGVAGVFKGKAEAAEKALNKCGLVAQAAVRQKITDGPFQPLSPKTLAKRRAKKRISTKPLIDTGAYRNAQTYVVRPKDTK